MIKDRKYIRSGTATSVTAKYVPTPQRLASWNKTIFAVSTFEDESSKTKEEIEDEQAWETYKKVKVQFYRVSQMLADS